MRLPMLLHVSGLSKVHSQPTASASAPVAAAVGVETLAVLFLKSGFPQVLLRPNSTSPPHHWARISNSDNEPARKRDGSATDELARAAKWPGHRLHQLSEAEGGMLIGPRVRKSTLLPLREKRNEMRWWPVAHQCKLHGPSSSAPTESPPPLPLAAPA